MSSRSAASYNQAAQAEAELSAIPRVASTLLAQARQIDEQRRSLDRRREQVRLLARPTAGATR